MAKKKPVAKKTNVETKNESIEGYQGELQGVSLDRLKKANPGLTVEKGEGYNELAESIEEIGLLQPLVVGPDFKIIAGRKRFAVVSSLDWDIVPCAVVPLEGVKAKLAEVDENLRRRQYTQLERAELVEQRMRLVLQLHPDRAPTRQEIGAQGAAVRKAKKEGKPLPPKVASLTKTIAQSSGRSERSTRRDLARIEKLTPNVRDTLKESSIANNGSYLDKLAKLSAEEQIEVVGTGAGDIKKRIDDALRSAKPAVPKPAAKGGKPKEHISIKTINRRLGEEALEFLDKVRPEDFDNLVAEYESILEFVKRQVEMLRPEMESSEEDDLAENF